ncbi:MAG TPA: ABC transporter substrate-binding protein [Acetobacteraceae bacterium]|nr:ABC transporter substrate-binding protein [Acetobacteraceae bacterium]
MKKTDKVTEALRRSASDVENHVIDEFLAGRIDRRSFLQRGSVLGMAAPLIGGIAGAVGALPIHSARAAAGGTVRVAILVPAGAVDPVTTGDVGGLCLLMQTGEFLAIDGPDLRLRPCLAESWSPNKDGTVWTFKLRQGVKFHNGQAMTADDVVATIDRLANPKNASNALSAFKGVLKVGNTKKVDDYTVAFHLDAPNGNFPYYVSSDNYNCIILPKDYNGGYDKTFIGTGPFKFDKYTAKVGASFVRNDAYWGKKALPDRTEFTFYADLQSQVLALQGRQVDLIVQIAVQGSQALLHDPSYAILSLKGSGHEQLHMRNDMGHFKDKRVRRAVALTLNRPNLVRGLFQGRASLGNDSPFAPVFPSTNKTVPQRHEDLRQAKQLLEAAGVGKGFPVTLTTEKYIEIPDYAVLVQNFAKQVGIDITLKVESQSAYYGKAVFGQSDWLDSEMGITDYGHRGVPNVFLAAPLLSGGTWNAAHFKNPAYDKLVADYVGALDLQSQQAVSGKIETLLLDETPIIFGYFYNQLCVTVKNLKGVQPTAISQVFLAGAHFA